MSLLVLAVELVTGVLRMLLAALAADLLAVTEGVSIMLQTQAEKVEPKRVVEMEPVLH